MKNIFYNKHLFFLLLLLICKTTFAQWSKVNMVDSTHMSRPTIFILGDTIYMGKGDTGFFVYSSAFRGYTTNSKIWAHVPTYPGSAGDWGYTFVINGTAYTGGGANYGFFNDFWKYKPNTGWVSLGTGPGGLDRGFAIAFVINGVGYVGTGDDYTCYNDLWQYDTLSNTWTQKASFPSPRLGCAAFSANGYGYAGLGGDNTGKTYRDMYRYDPIADRWDTMAPMPSDTGMEEPAYFTLCGKLIVTCGDSEQSGQRTTKQAWLFDPTISPKGRWHRLPDFNGPLPAYAPGGFAFKDTGYVYGGYDYANSNYYWAHMYKFVPNALLMSMLVSPTDTTICAGNSVTLNGSGATSYLWNTTDTTFSVTVTPKKDTLYTVSETNGTCVFIDTVAVHVSAGPAITITPDPATVCNGQTITLLANAGNGATYQWTNTADATDTLNVNPKNDTTYELQVSTSSCSVDTLIAVKVNASAYLAPQNQAACSGSGILLTVPVSGSNYVWTPDSTLNKNYGDTVIASPTSRTVYTVTGIDSLGCLVTANDTISVVPAPNKPSITISVTGDSLISSAGSYNQWYFDGSQINNAVGQVLVITGHPRGYYKVTVTNPANGCSTTSDSTTSINELSIISSQLSIYPNPFNNTIYLKISAAALNVNEWHLELTDVLGRTLLTMPSLNYSNEIDLSDLSTGMYFITVTNNTARAVLPMVKQN